MKLTRLFFSLATISLALHAQAPQATPAQSRLLCLYFDLNSMDAAAQSTALENATKFVQEQATPADRIAVMTYTSRLNVLQDFTADHETVLATLRSILPNTPTDTPAASQNGPAQNATEFNIFTADRQLAALQNAVELLAPLPEKKAMIYFSNGVPRNGVDNQAQLRATSNAAVRANVAIYSVDSRGLVAPPR
jgi:VWFA-related protein